MKEKLTLPIDKETKRRAKCHAEATGRSILAMVQEFLDAVTTNYESEFKPKSGSVTESLVGSLELPDKFKNMDYKQIIQQILSEKYDSEASS